MWAFVTKVDDSRSAIVLATRSVFIKARALKSSFLGIA